MPFFTTIESGMKNGLMSISANRCASILRRKKSMVMSPTLPIPGHAASTAGLPANEMSSKNFIFIKYIKVPQPVSQSERCILPYMKIDSNALFLAPLAGVTETIFRGLCRKEGADFVVSELVSAEGLLRSGKQTLRLCAFDEAERPIGIQLFGSVPDRMAAAAVWVEENIRPDFIDLNSGCPVPKVVKRNGGAALLRDPALFERIVTAMAKATTTPLTVKLRSGWNTGEWVDVEFARIAEGSGAQAVFLHARSKAMRYGGNAFWERIAIVKKAVAIPVIGNGDVRTPADALRMLRETGCDGIMVGRGALGNPWLFRQIKQALADKEITDIENGERYTMAMQHIARQRQRYGERLATKEMRKHVAWYLKGLPDATAYRDRIFRAASTVALEAVLGDALGQHVFS